MRNLYQKIKRMIYWGWALRDSFDFDYGYTEQLILLKLKRLKHEMDTAPYHRNLDDLYTDLKDPNGTTNQFEIDNTMECIKAHRALNVTIRLLERLQDANYYGEFTGLYDFLSTYTYKDKFDFGNDSTKIILSRKEFSTKLTALHLRESMLESRDRKWAYSLLCKYGGHWWT